MDQLIGYRKNKATFHAPIHRRLPAPRPCPHWDFSPAVPARQRLGRARETARQAARRPAARHAEQGEKTGANVWACLLQPTFKGSECTYRFFVLRTPHTMSDRGPARHSTAGDGAVPYRPARPLDHLSGTRPRPLAQIRTTLPLHRA